MIRIGTSGFSYKEWCGTFYPEKIAGPKMLTFYARRFPTVEINYTFRAMPRKQMLEKWVAETPDSFRFVLKAPQRITHIGRLKGVEKDLDYFIEVSGVLSDRLGPSLFQLGPAFKKDLPRLRDFIAILNRRMKAAFEFRHDSWFQDDVYAALREFDCALCIAESDKLAAPIEKTATYGYLRLRREAYSEADLVTWAERIKNLAREESDIYVFLKHETGAPALVERLTTLVAS